MNRTLYGLPCICLLTSVHRWYPDTLPDEATHSVEFCAIIGKLQHNELYCKVPKCSFANSDVKITDHDLSADGLQVLKVTQIKIGVIQ